MLADAEADVDQLNMIRPAQEFKGGISKWDVSRVTDMCGMFVDAPAFNADLSKWDVSSVKDMYGMFTNAGSFDNDISKWDVSNHTTVAPTTTRRAKTVLGHPAG